MMLDTTHLTTQLGQVPHFRGLAAHDLKTIVEAGHLRSFPAEAAIFRQSEPCAGMFVLLKGEVQLRVLGPQGQEHILSIVEPVIMFNEVAVLDGGPNVTTAVAMRDCLTWHIRCEQFHQLLDRYPVVGLGLLRVLAARTRLLIARHEDVAFRSVLARTAKLLLDLSGHGQQTIDRRAHSNRELAAHIATVPEALSRCLRTLSQHGAITLTRTSLRVADPQALAQLAQAGLPAFVG